MASRRASLKTCLSAGLRAVGLPLHDGVKLLGKPYPCARRLRAMNYLSVCRALTCAGTFAGSSRGAAPRCARPHQAAPPITGWMRRATVPEDASTRACTGRAHPSAEPKPGLRPAELHAASCLPRLGTAPRHTLSLLQLLDGHAWHVRRGAVAACAVRYRAP
jgi:hypothetical protein